MRVREHFLLGTELATITATAKDDCSRVKLFEHAVTAIVTRYQEEFGPRVVQDFLLRLGSESFEGKEWRLRPEDSCHEIAKKI